MLRIVNKLSFILHLKFSLFPINPVAMLFLKIMVERSMRRVEKESESSLFNQPLA